MFAIDCIGRDPAAQILVPGGNQGLEDGKMIAIHSRHGEIRTLADRDETLRPGVISLSHCCGKHPDEAEDPRRDGGSTARLIGVEDGYDPITGIPRTGAVPVTIRPQQNASPTSRHTTRRQEHLTCNRKGTKSGSGRRRDIFLSGQPDQIVEG